MFQSTFDEPSFWIGLSKTKRRTLKRGLFCDRFTERTFTYSSQPVMSFRGFSRDARVCKQPYRLVATHVDFTHELVTATTLVQQARDGGDASRARHRLEGSPRRRMSSAGATGGTGDSARQDANRADARIRTADPFITSEVLYQLSYVGVRPGV